MQGQLDLPRRAPKILIALACLALISEIAPNGRSGAQSAVVGDSSTWTVFTNAADHFSFRYPGSAKVTRPYAQNTTIELTPEVTVTVLAWSDPEGRPLEEWIDLLNAGVDAPWIAGVRSYQTASWRGLLADVRLEQFTGMQAIFVSAEGRIYQITFPSSTGTPDNQVYVTLQEMIQTFKFAAYPSSTIDIAPGSAPSPEVTQCPGAPFVLPTSGNLLIRWHEYLNPGACYDCNPGCDHTGIDVGDYVDAPVYAAYGGTLYWVGDCGIRIIHSIDPAWAGTVPDLTVQTYYTHLNWRRAAGAVSQGELIGGQGNCGGVIETHLHFSISEQWTDERCISNTYDPSSYLGARVNEHDNPQPKWIPVQCAGGCCGCGRLGTSKETDLWSSAARTKSSPAPSPVVAVTLRIVAQPVIVTTLPSSTIEPSASPTGSALPVAPSRLSSQSAPLSIVLHPVDPLRVPPGSANYLIPKAVFGSGGGPKASASYRMNGTQGQTTALNQRQSANYVLSPGYWSRRVPIAFDQNVYLPLVLRNH